MDNTTTNFFYCLLFLILFDCVVAVYSYAFHLAKANASVEVRNQFQFGLRAPAKWLFVELGGKTVLELLLLFRSNCKNQEEYFQKNPLRSIQFQRIGCAIFACLFTIIPFLGIFSVPANTGHLAIPYIIFSVAQIYTLIESWRFGHELIELSQSGSVAMNRDDMT